MTRNPVSTSSMISSAPYSSHSDAQQLVEPGRGRHDAHVGRAASVITHAISPPFAANACRTASASLYGSTMVSAVTAPVTPGESGSPKVATPEPAAASSASTCPW